MNDYVLITDSNCDLSPALAKKAGLEVIPMLFSVKDKEYLNYLDYRELDYKEFYKMLREGAQTSTAATNIDTFLNTFEPYLQKGLDILYLSFSSGLSSTFHMSEMAAEELSEKYPQSKIFCVDSLCASMGEGLLVYLAGMKKNEGASIEEVRDYLESTKLNLCHWFTVDDLFHLKRGGRVSATTALVGTVLSIKPVLHVDDEGHLINVGKARGRKASLVALFNHMKETAIDPKDQTVFISHGDSLEDAQFLADMIKKELKCKEVCINTIGPVIGSHSGPGTIALFFLGTKR